MAVSSQEAEISVQDVLNQNDVYLPYAGSAY